MKKNILLGVLGVGLVASLAWGSYNYSLFRDYKLSNENNNRRAFAEFASQLDQLETEMAKEDIANSAAQRIYYLSRVSTLCNSAAEDLSQLPAEQAGLSFVSQFLTQAGDYTGVLAQKAADQESINGEDEKTLAQLRTTMQDINTKIQDLAVRVATEDLDWLDEKPSFLERVGFTSPRIANATAEGEEKPAQSVRSGLDQLDASLQKLPPMSYEGEYSTRTVTEPLALPKQSVNQDQAMKIAQEFLNKVGYPAATPQFAGETQGEMGGYAWTYNDVYLEVSRQGGAVIQYRDQRPLDIRTLNLDKGKELAQSNLQKLGWKLAITSTEDYGSYLNVEAVVEENGARMYPDKIRVILAMDNGQIIGLDTTAYYAFHHERELVKKLDLAQAQAKLRTGFQVKENRMALIAVPGNKEAFCYEFRGIRNNEEYLVYINARTGTEEKIDRIISTPRGEYLE